MYTSLEFSKKLKDNGCESAKDWAYKNGGGQIREYPIKLDILNDICVKYAKEFFGERNVCRQCMDLNRKSEFEQCPNSVGSCNDCGNNSFGNFMKEFEYVPTRVLKMLQTNTPQEEIEAYIWENCLFNPENKN